MVMFRRFAQSRVGLGGAVLLACLGVSTLACTDDGDEGEEAAAETDEDEGDDADDSMADSGDGLGAGSCADVCGTPECGDCPTATTVEAFGVTIDATEVSNEQYAQFLAVDLDASVLPDGCGWKSFFEPEGWSADLPGAQPVVGVDWCDAMVFCAWAGKELCGAVGGGGADVGVAADPINHAWYRACSAEGANEFPYGASYDPVACNGDGSGQDAMLAGGTLSSCQGGVDGLFDMSGNAWEWTNACTAAGGDAGTECRRRGGSRYSGEDNLRCSVNSLRPRGLRDNGVGFRCCGGE